MGSTTSKPEAKVFTPAVPVDLSASFLAQLENSQESDYTRCQYTEAYIQECVARKLAQLESETNQKFRETADSATVPGGESRPSVASTNEKIEALIKSLQESAKKVEVDIPESLFLARSAVLLCLKDNAGKPLNCWDEVVEFKKLVRGL